ncbi:MAG: long-chain fatty acid--CoA ligase [Burkholderiales bacterium]|nr:long-chain fatty acid--CoA ligase [Burkholderiales bacterium]
MHTMRTPLLVARLLERGARLAPQEEIVTAFPSRLHRQTYADTRRRASQLAHALAGLGVRTGDRVGTLMWNNHRHQEAFYGVPSMGAVLHTLNLRLPPRELEYTIQHAEDRILLVDSDLLPLLVPLKDKLKTVEHIVVAADPADAPHGFPGTIDWEDRIADQPPRFDWPELDEYAPMGLCYTSGTTGNPKGVMYTHRSTYLHSMAQALTDAVGLSSTDTVLQVVPLFHVLGWGYPYTASMLGSKQILAHGHIEAEMMLDLIEREKVTFSAGVPTVWQSVRAAIEAQPGRWNLSSFKRINCGASAPAPSLIRWYWDHLGVEMIQTWGMTEINPLGVTSRRIAKRKHLTLSLDDQFANVAKTGLPIPGLELEIVDDAGTPLPHDGKTPGNLLIRGPWVCAEYYRLAESDSFKDGWLRTGDIARIDSEEYLIISDRSKDLIKSGGEWISSIDVENHILGMKGVAYAAVVAQPHPKWEERPVALVVRTPGATLTADDVVRHCAARFAKWQLPDEVLFVPELPLNSTGKLDKKTIRANLASSGYQLPTLR